MNFRNEDRAPLLFIAGEEDSLMPPAWSTSLTSSTTARSRALQTTRSSRTFSLHGGAGRMGGGSRLRPGVGRRSHDASGADHPQSLYGRRSTAYGTHPAVRPFRVDVPEEDLDVRRRIAAASWPSKELVEDRSQGVQLATLQALARYWGRLRLAQGGGEAQRLAPVHDRDRRGRDPLHPRALPARECVAADHDPRLAGLGHRAARDRRPADRPDRARRTCRGCLRPRAAVPARLRLLQRARRAPGAPAAPRRPGQN